MRECARVRVLGLTLILANIKLTAARSCVSPCDSPASVGQHRLRVTGRPGGRFGSYVPWNVQRRRVSFTVDPVAMVALTNTYPSVLRAGHVKAAPFRRGLKSNVTTAVVYVDVFWLAVVLTIHLVQPIGERSSVVIAVPTIGTRNNQTRFCS